MVKEMSPLDYAQEGGLQQNDRPVRPDEPQAARNRIADTVSPDEFARPDRAGGWIIPLGQERRIIGSLEVDGRAGDRACRWWIEAMNERPGHSARARRRSSCSKALTMRLISADRAPTAFAILRHVAVTVATSFMMVRA